MATAPTLATNAITDRDAQQADRLDAMLRWGALGILLCALSSLLGGIWDIQWHEDVGPDTFTTAPHLLLYAGAAGAGLFSLAVTLVCTWRVRTGTMAPRPPLVSPLRGAYWAPLGFVAAGVGSLLYLLFGLYDQWWHTIYGFDAVLDSPPHAGLGLADITMLSGAVLIGATLAPCRPAPDRGRRVAAEGALALALSIFLMNSASWQIGFAGEIAAGVDGQLLFVAALYPIALLAAVSVVRRPGAATVAAGVFTLVAAGCWAFSATATPLYASSLGLVARETAFGFPRIVAVLPAFVLPAALVIDGVLTVAQHRRWPVRRGVMTSAGLGMAVLVLLEGTLPRGVFALVSPASILAAVLAAGVVGALAGWAGWKLGVVLRHLTGTHPPLASQATGPRGAAVRAAATAAITLLLTPVGAAAHGGPFVIVHRETVVAGPYRMSAGFSEWPLRAERSLDMLFHLTDAAGGTFGIGGAGGVVTLVAPSGAAEERRLVRHPRVREDWGLDIFAFREEGRWTLRFDLAGVEGPGSGSLAVDVGPRPGPPVLVGWLLPLAVSLGMLCALTVGWRAVRPARLPETWAWG